MSGRILGFFKQTFHEFSADEAATRAGSVAYYAALSLAPMVLLFISITGFLGASTQERMIRSVEEAVGPQAGQIVSTVAARGGGQAGKAGVSMVISLAVIAFSASGVLAALQAGLNRIWDVKPAPGAGAKGWARKRLLSMAMVAAIAFLLLLSLVATTVIGMILPASGAAWNLVSMAVSFAVFVLLFALMFKVLPDVKIAWRDVWPGAAVTALLFAVGKYVIGLYIANADYSQSYGAAGSVVAMLVWVYYGSVIFFFGAEVTQVLAQRRGRELRPNEHAVHYREVIDGQPAPA
ncbi:MAG: YihY/virulence factor BrkB family protein [Planctomycetes bacterium]|nr:YihY/virulence factor BrkB family protein [Planctomycetota bacterium]